MVDRMFIVLSASHLTLPLKWIDQFYFNLPFFFSGHRAVTVVQEHGLLPYGRLNQCPVSAAVEWRVQ